MDRQRIPKYLALGLLGRRPLSEEEARRVEMDTEVEEKAVRVDRCERVDRQSYALPLGQPDRLGQS
eukprot:461375-Pyramimonas_sp.AAC.1